MPLLWTLEDWISRRRPSPGVAIQYARPGVYSIPGLHPAGVGRYHATWAITPHVSVMVDFSNNLMSNHGLAFLVVDVIIPVM